MTLLNNLKFRLYPVCISENEGFSLSIIWRFPFRIHAYYMWLCVCVCVCVCVCARARKCV